MALAIPQGKDVEGSLRVVAAGLLSHTLDLF